MSPKWDADAFASIYRQHTPKLFGLALRLTGGSLADAQDLVHTCWLRAATARRPFGGQSAFSSWLCGILVNCYREWRRVPPVEPAEGEPSFTPCFERDIEMERMLNALPPAWREVVVLHDLYGFTHKEIAALLGIAVGTSKSRRGRAHDWFRSTLAGKDEP